MGERGHVHFVILNDPRREVEKTLTLGMSFQINSPTKKGLALDMQETGPRHLTSACVCQEGGRWGQPPNARVSRGSAGTCRCAVGRRTVFSKRIPFGFSFCCRGGQFSLLTL